MPCDQEDGLLGRRLCGESYRPAVLPSRSERPPTRSPAHFRQGRALKLERARRQDCGVVLGQRTELVRSGHAEHFARALRNFELGGNHWLRHRLDELIQSSQTDFLSAHERLPILPADERPEIAIPDAKLFKKGLIPPLRPKL